MPQFPRTARRPLKVEPTSDEFLASAARSLDKIAEGLTDIVALVDALVVEDDKGEKRLRVVAP